MKRCPKCSRTYPDDNQKFCTVDGGRLESADSAEPSPELGATVLTNQGELNQPPPAPPVSDFNKTIASMPPPSTGEIRKGDTGPTSNRTVAASFQPAELPSQPPSPAPPPSQPPPQTYQPEPPKYQQPPPQQQQQPPPQPYQQPPPAYQPQPPQQYQQQPQQQYQQPHQQPPPAQPSAPMPHAPAPPQHMGGHAPQHAGPQPSQAPARKGSKMPLIIGLVVLVLLAGGAAYYFLVLNKKEQAGANTNSNANVANANTNANANVSANTNGNVNTNTSANANTDAAPFDPPPDSTQFVNTRANLSGKIADHFVPFSFYYPNSWELNTNIASEGTYFVRADRKLPPNYVQERFSVEWYESNGTYDADKSNFSSLVTAASNNLAKLPGYEKLSEGQTKVNSMDAYEITFKGLSKDPEKGDIDYWGRVIFLPPGVEGQKNGLKLTLLTSSLAPELEGIDDVGVKGELPVILESLRLK